MEWRTVNIFVTALLATKEKIANSTNASRILSKSLDGATDLKPHKRTGATIRNLKTRVSYFSFNANKSLNFRTLRKRGFVQYRGSATRSDGKAFHVLVTCTPI